jgi:dienelactone hydrolase
MSRALRTSRASKVMAVTALLLVLIGLSAKPYLEALSFVVRGAGLQGSLQRAAALTVVPITERLAAVAVPDGSIRVRIFTPEQTPRHTLLLISGLHPAGIEEPRLIAFARELAKSGLTVVTPDIPGLSDFAVTTGLTDSIERAAKWLAAESGLAPGGRIGLMGISFSGGLAVVAAGRPSLRDHVLYVFSVGGHHDLPRVLRYLCTGSETPGEDVRPPHDYGLAIVMLIAADRLVPPDQLGALQAMVRRFLWASYIYREDQSRAAREFSAVQTDSRTLPEPSATLLEHLNSRDVVALGSKLLPFIGQYGNEAALSPSQSPKPAAPVFALHGRDDNVIPAVESQHLEADLRDDTEVRLLLTPLISHAAADRPAHVLDILRLVAFWKDVLSQAAQLP